ncbi:MAG: asparaginase [Verrucomicrobiae bacterium]|nr:asparaginase [Verrucomicrobiae bacterium]
MNTETFGLRVAGAPISRRRVLTSLGLGVPAAAGWARQALTQEIPPGLPPGVKLPHVVLVSLGGTIASRGDTRLNLNNYGGPGNRVGPEVWIEALPELARIARVTPVDLRPPEEPAGTRGGMTADHLFKAAARIQGLADDPAVDGLVVTHGTNTMAETGWLMNLVLNTRKPVVFVGAQRPWTGISGDGPLNLCDAVRVAAAPAAAGKGVLHVMNQNINTIRDVMKTNAYRVDTFRSPDLGVLGSVDPDRVVFYMEPLQRHTYRSEFHLARLPSPPVLPAVEVLYAYMESPGYLVDALVGHGVKGIVIDGTGAGSPGGGQSEALKRAQEKGVVVVATARTRGGRVQDTPRRREAGIVPGDNLQPEKARILLQFALTTPRSPDDLQRIFREY